jgi:Fur family ferric uptake transcriptional regulator
MIRNTLQRRAISRVFSVDVPPLTPQEVLVSAQEDIPALGIATVYRTLKSMVESGALVVVNLPGEASRYELTEKRHHHFFSCRACGKVSVVNKCIADFKEMIPSSYKLERHEVVLYGLCDKCHKL